MNDKYVLLRPVYHHFRIVKASFPRKGPPKREWCMKYSRKLGWIDDDRSELTFMVGRKPQPKGGATVCLLVDENGRAISWGLSKCSMADNFSYRIGRDLALAQALRSLASSIEEIKHG